MKTKTAYYLLALALTLLGAASCKNSGKTLLPNVSGRAGEVIVVIDKENWEGNLGSEVRSILARECEFLPQKEPLYSLVNITSGAFGDMFKYHRNIVYFNIDPQVEKQEMVFRTDVWSRPQCL